MTGLQIIMIAQLFLLPVIILIVAIIAKKNPPKEINGFRGYRTALSKSSQEAWDYANKRIGELLMMSSLYTFIIGVISAVIVIAIKMNVVGVAYTIVLSVVLIIQVIVMVLPTLRIEKELKNEEYKK